MKNHSWKRWAAWWGKWITQSKRGTYLLSSIFILIMLYDHILPLNVMVWDRDYVIQLWNLWVVNEAIKEGQNPYVTNLIYYPVGANLARYNLSSGFFLITFLVEKLSGGDSLYPLYTRRILVLITFPLLLWFSYWVLRELGLAQWPSVIAAVAYTFSNYYMKSIDLGLNHISGFFIPAIAFFVICLFKKPKISTALITSLLSAAVLYFTEYALFIYMGFLFLGGVMSASSGGRKQLFTKFCELGLKSLLASLGLFILIALPFILNWLASSDVLPPDPQEAYLYSSNLLGFFIPPEGAAFLYDLLFSWLNKKMVGQGFTYGIAGSAIFIGFPLLIFGLVSIFRTNQRLVRISALISIIFFVLSLGPVLKVFTFDTALLMPYGLLALIPPFDVGRAPVRFVVIGLFFWMVVAAFGLQWFQNIILKKYGQLVAAAAMLFIFLWVVSEIYLPVPHQQPYVIPPQLEGIVAGPVINLPLKFHNGWALSLQMFHHQPVATGEISRNTAAQWAHYHTLEVLYQEALKTGSCQSFVEMGFRNIIIWPGVPEDVIVGLTQSPDCSLNIVNLLE
ncbi:MAG: hypothetical protein JW953_15930 [Anaerolineae bacterium]|nr:hypothetical protein [Anaerolineae bacterium]